MRKFRIGLCGGHGTGKTTFAHKLMAALKESGLNAGMSSGVSRSTRSGFLRGSFVNQTEIMANLMANEQILLEKHDVVVCDRTVYDVQAYSEFYEGSHWTSYLVHEYVEEHGDYDIILFFSEVLSDNKDPERNKMDSSGQISESAYTFWDDVTDICLTRATPYDMIDFDGDHEELIEHIILELERMNNAKESDDC